MKVIRLASFRLDVLEEFAWLAQHASVLVARRWRNALAATIGQIARQPELGRPRNDLQPRGIRSIQLDHFRRWLLFYRIEDKTLILTRVKHGSMHLPSLFSGEPPPET